MENDQMDDTKIKNNLDHIQHVIVVLSGKGGVGKSTVAANLALALSNEGFQTGLLDSDFHGPTIPTLLGIEDASVTQSNKGLHPVQATEHLKVLSMGFLIENKDNPVIWRGPMKMGAMKQLLGDFSWGSLDYLIIDLPPGTGDEPLTIAQLIPKLSGAIIVTTPQDVALVSVRKSIRFVQKLGIPVLGIIENMSGFTCPHCHEEINIFKKGGGKHAAEDFNVPFLGSIPLDPQIVESGDKGGTIMKENSTLEHSMDKIINQLKKIIKKRGDE